MNIVFGDKHQLARLFNFFLQGERLALDCATRQSELFPDEVSRRFFQTQARQELFHARVFRCGIGILAPKGLGRSSMNPAMERYRRQIETFLTRGDLALSLLGLQIVLEGFGDVALMHISRGCGTRGLGFDRIRRLILGQEDAHHAYGLQRFEMFFDSPDCGAEIYRTRFNECYGLLSEVIDSVSGLFEHFDEDPRQYLSEFESGLPVYFQTPVEQRKIA